MAKTAEQKRATLELKIARARAALQRVNASEKRLARRLDTRRKIIVGGTVLALMAEDVQMHRDMVRVLRRRVKRDLDRAAIADLIG